MGDDYEERPNDHLVEPFFGGLGVEEELEASKPEAKSWWRKLLERLGFLRSL